MEGFLVNPMVQISNRFLQDLEKLALIGGEDFIQNQRFIDNKNDYTAERMHAINLEVRKKKR